MSQLPAVQEALFDLLDGYVPLNATVTWGPPTGDDAPAEFVAVGAMEEAEGEWRVIAGGANPIPVEETWNVELWVVSLSADGTDLRPAYERTHELVGHVEDAIRADVSLSNVIRECRLERRRGDFWRADRQRGYRVRLTLTGTARI